MKLSRISMGLIAVVALSSAPAFALLTLGGDFFNVINGTFADPQNLTFGTYMQGSENFGYNPNSNSYTYGFGGGPSNGNARDYYWVHDLGNGVTIDGVLGGNPANGLWFDLGGQANKVAVFPVIDHGPLPEEALEHTVYLSDDLVNWTRASLETAYDQGWEPDPAIADGWTGVYSLASGQTFRYASVTWGGASSIHNDGDTEIDAVAGLTEEGNAVVPEPGTMSLLLLGLGSLAARFRRRK